MVLRIVRRQLDGAAQIVQPLLFITQTDWRLGGEAIERPEQPRSAASAISGRWLMADRISEKSPRLTAR
jgi:hypothetical protein